MADIVMGNTESVALRQAAIAALVQRELIDQAVVAPNVWNVSQYAQPGMKSVAFPKAGSFTVQMKVEDEQAQAQAVTYSTDELTLNQEAVVQWIIPFRSQLQSMVDLEADLVGRAARAHAAKVDDLLVDAMIAGAASGNNVTLSGSFGREEITEMRAKLRRAKWPTTDLTLAIAPELEEDMLNVADFINAEKYGSVAPIQNGEIGRVFGVRVVVSTLFTASQAVMFHREAIALAFQQQPIFRSMDDLANLGKRYSLDQLFGLKVTQGGAGISKLA